MAAKLFPSIAEKDFLDGAEFFNTYVEPGIPVLLKGRIAEWPALTKWNAEYFSEVGGDTRVNIKMGDVSEGNRSSTTFREYLNMLKTYEEDLDRGKAKPGTFPYMHDVPLFHILPEIEKDTTPFPYDLFPRWYHLHIRRFAQFFLSGKGSKTPLHFDTLYTHNLFFQIKGRKKFILIPAHQKKYCYMRSWRWSAVNAEDPDFDRFPLFSEATPQTVVVEPGDVLFIPSGTLHEVISLEQAISFNIDWHTARTARKGTASIWKGAPLENLYYNLLIASGLILNLPSDWIFRYYKSYLNYIS